LVGYRYASNDQMIDCYKQFKYDVLYVLHDVLGFELMSLV